MSKIYNRLLDREVIESFGISILTGEACAYSMRLLCDVNEDGLELINSAFGMCLEPDEGSYVETMVDGMMRRHNSQVNSKPSIASIMLTHTMIDELVLFGVVDRHLEQGEIVLSATPKENSHVNPLLWGGTRDEYTEKYANDAFFNKHWTYRIYSIYEKQPRRGSMNVHAFTGRAP